MSYRGEDQTLETIRARVKQIEETEPGAFEACDQAKWNIACDRIADEMKAEGLNTTAEFVLSYKVNH
jgi:hypothetical protein